MKKKMFMCRNWKRTYG